MLSITTWSNLRAAIESHPAATILQAHADRQAEFADQPLGELCEFLLVEPTDTLADLATKLGRAGVSSKPLFFSASAQPCIDPRSGLDREGGAREDC